MSTKAYLLIDRENQTVRNRRVVNDVGLPLVLSFSTILRPDAILKRTMILIFSHAVSSAGFIEILLGYELAFNLHI